MLTKWIALWRRYRKCEISLSYFEVKLGVNFPKTYYLENCEFLTETKNERDQHDRR